jgi:hypothetical protein
MNSRRVDPRALAVLVLLVGAAAFVPNCSGTRTARNEWNGEWGPVVPHKSFPTDCALCHLPDRWDRLRQDFSFDHEKETGHPLAGAHNRATCLRCHNDFGPVTEYVARGCVGCHLDVHEARLGASCLRCHTQEDWRPTGLIAVHGRTRFPLVGVHATIACEQCHLQAPAGEFRGAPTRCELCHRDDLAGATSPDHIASGWTRDCEDCHTSTTWGAAGFRHSFFPLTGGHAGLDCSRCHAAGDFSNTPTDCYACHSDDYDRQPDHRTNGFGTDCRSCHNTSSWEDADFNHSFPLRGKHDVSCNECHIGGNTIQFNCLMCHEHERSRMDDKHDEVRNYRYDSSACLECHPGGEGD